LGDLLNRVVDGSETQDSLKIFSNNIPDIKITHNSFYRNTPETFKFNDRTFISQRRV